MKINNNNTNAAVPKGPNIGTTKPRKNSIRESLSEEGSQCQWHQQIAPEIESGNDERAQDKVRNQRQRFRRRRIFDGHCHGFNSGIRLKRQAKIGADCRVPLLFR